MRKLLVLLGVMLFLWTCAATPAAAVMITGGSGTLFQNGFEVNITGSPDQDPDPALWTTNEAEADAVQVLDSSVQSMYLPPAAYEGVKYTKIYRPAGASESLIAAPFEQQSAGTVHMELMMYIPVQVSADTLSANIALSNNLDNGNGFDGAVVWIAAFEAGNSVRAYYSDAWHDTGVTWTRDAWQKWEIDLSLDSDTCVVTVDGAASGSMSAKLDGPVSWAVLRGGQEGSVFSVDTVPEPATLSLLVIGGLGVLFRRKR
ncbi:MAG: PEP-CTERM sorting domain-containing protein [Phycisphaerae bacterium]|nr:PEP-CTERM sorting domain-containing protein [Phycisphaerae bacterium]